MALSPELAAIEDAMNKQTGDGRNLELAVQLSEAYVRAHPELTAEMHDWTLEKIVDAMSIFSSAGFTERYWQLEAYQLAKFPRQQIGGEYHAVAKLPEL